VSSSASLTRNQASRLRSARGRGLRRTPAARAASLLILTTVLILASCGGSSPGDPASQPRLGLELVAQGFTSPVALASPRDDTGRLFIADQVGTIWVLSADGERSAEPFLDLRDRMVGLNITYDERGLLGLALHPDFAENGRFFVYYSAPLRGDAPSDWDHTSHLSEFSLSEVGADRADPESERILLQVDQPQSNHNGGQIAFGPDGYLYVPLGDGGGANDTGLGHPPQGNGQDRTTLLGSILRLDVDGAEPYGVPADNPFSGDQGREEIYAYGLRNPFRISFDAGGDGQLFAGDVGQNLWEEVDIVSKGSNYGWHIREGFHCFDPEQPGEPAGQCPDTGPYGEPLVDPILEYSHSLGISVIGGYVYRGSALPELQGHYIFGDWSTTFVNGDGKILDAVPPASPDSQWEFRPFTIATSDNGQVDDFVLSFGEDTDGELYVLTTGWPGPVRDTGKVYKLVPAP
jgi:glucose/arabinose dehydrogenase